MDPKELWKRFLQEIQKYVSKPAFEMWFKDSAIESLEESNVVIAVSSDTAKEYIEENYMPIVKEALRRITGLTPDVAVVVQKKKTNDVFSNTLLKQPKPKSLIRLNPRYTFDEFVVGDSNRLAYAGARAVAENPGKKFNPLFIWGGVGLGKTHLLHAIGNYLVDQDDTMTILYITAEEFTNEMVESIKKNSPEDFRAHYRTVDVLLIDDIQFIAGKEATQTEFFHTFNTLYQAGKQIVMTSDHPPQELTLLEDRLRSRFQQGLTVDIQRPDFETRVAILERKAQKEGLDVPSEVIEFIAHAVTTNIRELEGALTKVIALATLQNVPLTLGLAKQALGEIGPDQNSALNAQSIAEQVASYFNMTLEDLKSSKRNQDLVMPRQIAMYLIRQYTDMSYPEIAAFFNKKDHTTVMYAIGKIRDAQLNNVSVRHYVNDIKKRLNIL
ncbi:chromosomal replication initiator protein DnaA [Coprothermobacter platensis]|uniref:chromosomal replication initiator protein DnaA n=1 Tax=Coprothermobacter platensis TaxID=108819 RepID=UPI0003663477|nr:chromosomal replication initiator protein DnaA [Coprothermobacter platensis]